MPFDLEGGVAVKFLVMMSEGAVLGGVVDLARFF
jgi:hypothetical protein